MYEGARKKTELMSARTQMRDRVNVRVPNKIEAAVEC